MQKHNAASSNLATVSIFARIEPVENLAEALAFVNGQTTFHAQKALALGATSPRRTAQHEKFSAQFIALAGFLERQALHVDKLENDLEQRPPPPNGPIQLSLRLEDIDGLPDELIQELSITDGDKMDFMIQALMNERSGVMSLDQLLVALYRKTGEVHKRANLNARLYRMANKGALFSVPGRKGVYSTRELDQATLASLSRATD